MVASTAAPPVVPCLRAPAAAADVARWAELDMLCGPTPTQPHRHLAAALASALAAGTLRTLLGTTPPPTPTLPAATIISTWSCRTGATDSTLAASAITSPFQVFFVQSLARQTTPGALPLAHAPGLALGPLGVPWLAAGLSPGGAPLGPMGDLAVVASPAGRAGSGGGGAGGGSGTGGGSGGGMGGGGGGGGGGVGAVGWAALASPAPALHVHSARAWFGCICGGNWKTAAGPVAGDVPTSATLPVPVALAAAAASVPGGECLCSLLDDGLTQAGTPWGGASGLGAQLPLEGAPLLSSACGVGVAGRGGPWAVVGRQTLGLQHCWPALRPCLPAYLAAVRALVAAALTAPTTSPPAPRSVGNTVLPEPQLPSLQAVSVTTAADGAASTAGSTSTASCALTAAQPLSLAMKVACVWRETLAAAAAQLPAGGVAARLLASTAAAPFDVLASRCAATPVAATAANTANVAIATATPTLTPVPTPSPASSTPDPHTTTATTSSAATATTTTAAIASSLSSPPSSPSSSPPPPPPPPSTPSSSRTLSQPASQLLPASPYPTPPASLASYAVRYCVRHLGLPAAGPPPPVAGAASAAPPSAPFLTFPIPAHLLPPASISALVAACLAPPPTCFSRSATPTAATPPALPPQLLPRLALSVVATAAEATQAARDITAAAGNGPPNDADTSGTPDEPVRTAVRAALQRRGELLDALASWLPVQPPPPSRRSAQAPPGQDEVAAAAAVAAPAPASLPISAAATTDVAPVASLAPALPTSPVSPMPTVHAATVPPPPQLGLGAWAALHSALLHVYAHLSRDAVLSGPAPLRLRAIASRCAAILDGCVALLQGLSPALVAAYKLARPFGAPPAEDEEAAGAGDAGNRANAGACGDGDDGGDDAHDSEDSSSGDWASGGDDADGDATTGRCSARHCLPHPADVMPACCRTALLAMFPPAQRLPADTASHPPPPVFASAPAVPCHTAAHRGAALALPLGLRLARAVISQAGHVPRAGGLPHALAVLASRPCALLCAALARVDVMLLGPLSAQAQRHADEILSGGTGSGARRKGGKAELMEAGLRLVLRIGEGTAVVAGSGDDQWGLHVAVRVSEVGPSKRGSRGKKGGSSSEN